MNRIFAIARKEVFHILRDPRSLAVAVLMPLMMLVLFGYALDMDLEKLRVAVLDEDHTVSSRAFVREMTGSDFIVEAGRLGNRGEVEPGFRQGLFHAALVIPSGYGEALVRGETARVQVLVDGADATTAESVDNYLNQIVARVNDNLRGQTLAAPMLLPRIRFVFNPELESAAFIVPGLVALIMMMICALLTSIAITREKETGTMEQMLTTPVTATQVVVGKVIPYTLIAIIDAALVLALGVLIFHVPMHGSWLVLAGYSLLFLLVALALGLMINTITDSQQVAMIMSLMITFLPTIILSGFVFPIESMPRVLQWITYIIPARYYMTVIRGVMLAGESWYPFEGGIMLAFVILLMTVSIRKFSSRLE